MPDQGKQEDIVDLSPYQGSPSQAHPEALRSRERARNIATTGYLLAVILAAGGLLSGHTGTGLAAVAMGWTMVCLSGVLVRLSDLDVQLSKTTGH